MDPLKTKYSELIIEEALSAGTFAEVYCGTLVDLHQRRQTVAIKVMKKKWIENKDLINRLEDEANLLNQLKHPNIISALGFIEVEGRPAIVMELIRGIDLQKILKVSPLPPKVAFSIASKVAEALNSAYKHSLPNEDAPLSVVHRDIKPSNIMLTQDQEVKVLDFGASRSDFVGRKGETTVFQFGSPKYMSNERKKGDRGSHTSDVYSLGIMLIEMLSGKLLDVLPPNSQNEHKRFVQQRLGTLQFGLPTLKWELAAKQVIDRMCAFWKMHRISAEQCAGRLQTFSENASGEDIASFWNRVVIPLSNRFQSKAKKGPLTGKTIIFQSRVVPTPKSEDRTREQEPQASPISNPTSPKPSLHHSKKDIENNKETFRLSQRKRLLVYGVTAAAISFSALNFVTLVGLGFARKSSKIFAQDPSIPQETSVTSPIPSAAEQRVHLSIEREVFSSVKLKDANGKTILQAKRTRVEHSGEVPTGTYRLEVKYVGDSEIYATDYIIDQSVEIFCGQSDGKNSNCIDGNQNVVLDRKDSE